MGRMLKYFGAAAIVGACATGGALTVARGGPSGAPGWPVSGQERLALQGLRGQGQLLDKAIAEVASGSRERAELVAQIAYAYHEFRLADEDLQREARRRCGVPEGVAFILSGSTWVTK